MEILLLDNGTFHICSARVHGAVCIEQLQSFCKQRDSHTSYAGGMGF